MLRSFRNGVRAWGKGKGFDVGRDGRLVSTIPDLSPHLTLSLPLVALILLRFLFPVP
jgi:hypothetical protein